MHSITIWNLAQRPNYTTNVDKMYHYSEVPYIGQYHLVTIPQNAKNSIDHVDYWGEGRINTVEGSSGFTDSYNVNHQYQLVSNGPDRDRKIPNRIPVMSYTNCSTSSYIKDNSVKVVTLMGAPINKSCAKDIARMVNDNVGKVVIFGFENETAADVKNLDEEMTKKCLLYTPGYNLTGTLKGLSLFDVHRAYLNITELTQELHRNITESAFDNAVIIAKSLQNIKKSNLIADGITNLLKEGNKNIITYTYKLWHDDAKHIVMESFPTAFKLIFSEGLVKIVSKKDLIVLKLDTNADSNNERLALGDISDVLTNKWKIMPVSENSKLFFKIVNVEQSMYLKLVSQENQEGNKVKGTTNSSDLNCLWSLEPLKVNGDVVFFIINHQLNQGLKFDNKTNMNGERQAVGNEFSDDQSENFGWLIVPYENTYEYETRTRPNRR